MSLPIALRDDFSAAALRRIAKSTQMPPRVGVVHERYALETLARGKLVRMLEPWCQPFSGFTLYYPSRRHASAALRRFIEWSQSHRRAIGS